MSQGTPRKFAEKIAIMEKKQNEDQEVFTSVMRDVRAITSNCTAAPPVCSSPQALAPPMHWNRPGGSLPNVHEMVQQQPDIRNWPYWSGPAQINPPHHARGRSPGAPHYHPYNKSSKKYERYSPVGQIDDQQFHYSPNNHLLPPDALWPKTRSDPTIFMNLYQQQQRLQNFNINDLTVLPPSHISSPVQPPLPLPLFQANTATTTSSFNNGMEQQELHNNNNDDGAVGSLPDLPGPVAAIPSCAYQHQTITQRHSTSLCHTLVTPLSLTETQSAPTSPAQSIELPAPTSWPSQRHYSNSPEPREIPNIVLTDTEGQLDCFQDLQDLHLDANELQQLLNSGEQVDPVCENQLLE
ncbi:unnamed protein product [Thelazia callipaeda]|uniref:TORC_N domain-containing protein n=1 Tax=Thelazia callipaeda TaxID=103827 RepID=A0A0N5D0J5_THECL|nr:unnamed protein product [Thelazia callipaeda]